MQRLTQAPGWKQPVGRILRRNQHNVEIAGQGAMLKSVIEQMKLRPEFQFRKSSSLVAIFSYDHWHAQFAREQQRFIAELLRQARGIDQPHSSRFSSVSPRQHVELDAARREQLAEQKHERSLSRAARGKIAHADHRAL